MKKFLKKILNKFLNGNKPLISLKDKYIASGHLVVGERTVVNSLNIILRSFQKQSKRLFVTVGNDSIVSGDFTIENPNGNISIGDRTFIGGGSFITINSIEIGNDVLVSWGCTFMDNNAHSLSWKDRAQDVLDWKKGIEENKIGFYKNWNNVKSSPIKLNDKCWIGFEVVILKGVTIGEGAIVASRSVVTKDVPAWTIVAGNPAEIVREIPKEDRI